MRQHVLPNAQQELSGGRRWCRSAMALRYWGDGPALLFFYFFKLVFLSSEVVCGRETLDVGANVIEDGQISLSSTYDRSWCVAKDYVKPDSVQEGLNWACGFGGADCLPIQLGNACYLPNTVYSHASYAFNSYYQTQQHASGTCDFDGVATVAYEDPSYPGCAYPFRAGEVGLESKGRRRCICVYSAFIVGAVVMLCMLTL